MVFQWWYRSRFESAKLVVVWWYLRVSMVDRDGRVSQQHGSWTGETNS